MLCPNRVMILLTRCYIASGLLQYTRYMPYQSALPTLVGLYRTAKQFMPANYRPFHPTSENNRPGGGGGGVIRRTSRNITTHKMGTRNIHTLGIG